jgi:signal transduction histidine kinase
LEDIQAGQTAYARQVGRALEVAESALRATGNWPSLVDVVVAGALFAVVFGLGVANSSTSDLSGLAVVCGLTATTTVAWRSRAPEAAVIVAGAATIGYEWLIGAQTFQSCGLVVGLTVLLAIYTAGVRGISRRQTAQLAALVIYGIAVCVVAAAASGSLSVSNVVEYALPVAVTPAAVGLLVARQRSLVERLTAATARLRAEEEMRLALVAEVERNRFARDLHDVVAHAVSVMVVQAGAARITLAAEPDLTRTALEEVAQAGRAAMVELRRITGTGGDGEHEVTAPSGIAGIVEVVKRRRASGLAVQMTVTGSGPDAPAAVDVALYRLVQEALTNIVKHAPTAEAEVNVTIEPGAVDVLVRNSPPKESTGFGAPPIGSGQGLIGMRERVESCAGCLSYGPRADGGFEVRARLPLTAPRAEPSYSLGWRPGVLIARIGGLGLSLTVVATMCVLGVDAYVSPEREQPLALNVALAAGMALPLVWRRSSSLWFLVAVNLLALPISNSVGSDRDLFLVSTYVFVVPVWTVAASCPSGPAVAGLVAAAGFNVGECLYWHVGATSITANLLLTGLLWAVGRFVWSQRLLAGDLQRTYVRLEAEQQTRELLRLAAEHTRMVGELHSLVAEQVSAMIAAAECTRKVIGMDSAASAASVAAIEQTGREALARLREILGLLRAEHDPERLSPRLGVEHFHDLVARYRQSGTRTRLEVSGAPVPLLGGLDVLAYRIVEEVLAAAGEMAPSAAVSLRFCENNLCLDFVLARPLVGWARRDTRAKIQRSGGTIRQFYVAAGERITVELPLASALVSQ